MSFDPAPCVMQVYAIMRRIEEEALFEVNDHVTWKRIETVLNANYGELGTFTCDPQTHIDLMDTNIIHVECERPGFKQTFHMGDITYSEEEWHRFHNQALTFLIENKIDHIVSWVVDFTSFPAKFSSVILVNRTQPSEKNELLFNLKLQMEQVI